MTARVLLCLLLCLAASAVRAGPFDTGALGDVDIRLPDGPPAAVIFLFSDDDGWNGDERRLAFSLRDQGAAVVGIDLPSYLARLEAAGGDCAYLIWDIETLSHAIQRSTSGGAYHSPILAGTGAGGALALALAGQAPAATIGRFLAVDPAPAVPLRKTLCGATVTGRTGGGTVYRVPAAPPGALDVVVTGTAPAPAGVGDARREPGDAARALRLELAQLVARAADDADDAPSVLELPATPAYDSLAIVYSGDGGWRDLDRSIAEILQREGVPTIGVDTLRYFWTRKDPADAAADLADLIDTYTDRWKVHRVLLVGYSFGADVLPALVNRLPAPDRSRIVQLSLLSLTGATNFEISVSGWVGEEGAGEPTLPEVRRIDPGLVQCFYGTDDDESVCARLAGAGVQVVATEGSHHFDGDYGRLAAEILDGLKRRLGASGAR